jgi:hypothetical protein
MWSPATRQITFTGSVEVSIGPAAPPKPLIGVMIDVYRFTREISGFSFEHLSQIPARTGDLGEFDFNDLPVLVNTQMLIPGSPPYTPVEVIEPSSLPNLVFRVSIEADVLTGGVSEGNQIVTLYDERELIDEEWLALHSDRINVPLSGSPALTMLITDDEEVVWYDEALIVAGADLPEPTVLGNNEVHLLRVGRAIRDEIGELGDTRAEFIEKPGYMNSTDTWATPDPSFFPGRVDAPFGSKLHIGGYFGANFQPLADTDNLYYTMSVSEYTGSVTNPFDASHLTNTQYIVDPLFNKRFIVATRKWETLHLGPFEGTTTGGTEKIYYKRPNETAAGEYYPFSDLLAIWNSAAAPNTLMILTIDVYRRTGGTETNPDLTQEAIGTINAHLPLQVDNRRPVPKYIAYDPSSPAIKFNKANAHFLSVPETVDTVSLIDVCNHFTVAPGTPADGNEALLLRYNIEDGYGNPHPHLLHYHIYAEYTPKAELGAPDSRRLNLKDTFATFDNISATYSRTTPPTPPHMEIYNYRSVVVPEDEDAWPPEPCGDKHPEVTTCDATYPCEEYALEVSLGCSVRTVNGWSRIFGHPHVSRHLIVKRT